MPDTGAGLSDRGRPIHGPTPPGQGVPCSRQSPLTGAEVAEVAAIIVGARLGRHAAGCRSGCGPGTGTRW